MSRVLAQIGLVCLVSGLIGGWLVGWSTEFLAIPSINIAVGLALTLIWVLNVWIPSLRSEKEVATKRATKIFSYSSAYLVLVICVVGFANYLFSKSDWMWDLTQERLFTLSEKTVELVKKINFKIQVVIPATDLNRTEINFFKDIFNRLNEHTDKLELVVFNPFAQQTLAREYNLQRNDVGILVMHTENGKRTVKMDSLNESGFVSALAKLLSDRSGVLGYLVGHGEPELEGLSQDSLSSFVSELKKEGFEIRPVNLVADKKVPENIGALLVIGPSKPLDQSELQLISDYIKNGGRIMMAVDFFGSIESIQKLASLVGIEVGEYVVIDPSQSIGGPADIVVNEFSMHPVTRGLNANKLVAGSNFVSVNAKNTAKFSDDDQGVIGSNIVSSSRNSWAETGISSRKQGTAVEVRFDEGVDKAGPIPVVAVFNKYLDGAKKETKVVVFGSHMMFSNVLFPVFFTSDLILNSINWLLDYEEESLVRPKSLLQSMNPIPNQTLRKYFLLTLLLPQLILIFGLLISWRRTTS
ncbi:MAG: Gldg family protein [Deltaproteobacteria bacterium]|nr:Gldg family protein [Deltaproteobacteria bacterium]